MNTEITITEYQCPFCKRVCKFPAYVYAHWDFPLRHECECGAVNTLLQGEMTAHKPPIKAKNGT